MFSIHTWSHPDLTNLTNDQIAWEILWTAQIIRDVIGQVPTLFRPPLGAIDSRVRGIIVGLGLTPVLWNEGNSSC